MNTQNNILGNIFICIYSSPCIGMLQGRDLKGSEKNKMRCGELHRRDGRKCHVFLKKQKQKETSQGKENPKSSMDSETKLDASETCVDGVNWPVKTVKIRCTNMDMVAWQSRIWLPRSYGKYRKTSTWVQIFRKKSVRVCVIYNTIFLVKQIDWP